MSAVADVLRPRWPSPARALSLGPMSAADSVTAELLAAAQAALPGEACGLLLGRREAGGVQWCAVHPARNLDSELDRFRVHPEDHLAAEREAQRQGLEVLGAWHSHPRGPARPSAADLAGSPEGWWMAIVGCAGGGAPELRWWAPGSAHLG